MNDFDDEIEDLENDEIEDDYVNDPEMDKNIQRYIKRSQAQEDDEDLTDKMSPLEQISRAKASLRKQNPSAALIIARAQRDRSKI